LDDEVFENFRGLIIAALVPCSLVALAGSASATNRWKLVGPDRDPR